MGNCLRRESSTEWEDEEWGFPGNRMKEGKGHLLGDDGACFTVKQTRSTSSLTEVKIKITKKELQQLVVKMDVNELTVHEALTQLIKVGDDQYHSDERPWKPALQSIQEVN